MFQNSNHTKSCHWSVVVVFFNKHGTLKRYLWEKTTLVTTFLFIYDCLFTYSLCLWQKVIIGLQNLIFLSTMLCKQLFLRSVSFISFSNKFSFYVHTRCRYLVFVVQLNLLPWDLIVCRKNKCFSFTPGTIIFFAQIETLPVSREL